MGFVHALVKYWISLVSGLLSFLLFFLNLAMATPTLEMLGWVGAYLFLVVAAISLVWGERRDRRALFLKMCRLAADGEQLLDGESRMPSGVSEALPWMEWVAELQVWRRDVLAAVEGSKPSHVEHVTSVGEFKPDNIDGQAALLLRRVRELCDVLRDEK